MLKTKPAKYDSLGIALNAMIILPSASQYLIGIAGMYFKLDPVYLVQKYVSPLILEAWNSGRDVATLENYQDFSLSEICWLIARSSQIITTAQACRALPWMDVMTTLLVHLVLQCIERLDSASERILLQSQGRVERYFGRYSALKIIFLVSAVETGALVSIMMAMGMILSIMCNFTSVKLYGTIPTMVYVSCTLVGVLIQVFVHVMVPMAVNVYEMGKGVAEKWKGLLGRSGNKKYLVRRVKSIKVLGLYAELFGFKMFRCQKSTKRRYYYAILEYTCTALLSLDASWFM